jgi:plastocyanin
MGTEDAVISVMSPDHRRVKQEQKEPARQTMVHTEHGFEPQVLPVVVGSRVDFLNRDQVYHKVFSISPAKSFNLGSQAPGARLSLVCDVVGVISLHCELHPDATGYIVVLPDERFTQPNARGEFDLPKVAPGMCTITAWHPTYGEVKRRVDVPKGGQMNVRLAY